MKKLMTALMLVILLVPSFAFAESHSADITSAIGIEIVATVFISVYGLLPLSRLISEKRSGLIFGVIFAIRVFILLVLNIVIADYIAVIDIFVGVILVFCVRSVSKKVETKKKLEKSNAIVDSQPICQKCGSLISNPSNKFCTNCGVNLALQNNNQGKVIAHTNDYDPMYSAKTDKMLELFIERKIKEMGMEDKIKYVPVEALKRRNILNLIFAFLVFVFTTLIFFHFPVYTYLIGMVILFVFFSLTRKYNLVSYVAKEAKARPSEKITNIIMTVKERLVPNTSPILKYIGIVVAIIVPCIIFLNPRIMYEKTENGYAVRFYTLGVKGFTTAVIPDTYKGEEVVELRGNCFSNMPFLRSVTLPDTITSIRGQAFKNDMMLTNVNLPKNLQYLGGGSFYNCKSLKSIELPDSLTEMGGETFYNASSLVDVKLPSNLTEIKGSTFEGCISLEKIEIPDTVKRIGGHAFYGCGKLSEVNLSQYSNLDEIGSSAFRECASLKEIVIPRGTSVDSRAFKGSPTKVKYLTNGKGYLYNSWLKVSLGKIRNVAVLESDSICYDTNAKIGLESINRSISGNEFNLVYTDKNGSQKMTLSEENPNIQINDNLYIQIIMQDYVNDFRADYVYFNTYFN